MRNLVWLLSLLILIALGAAWMDSPQPPPAAPSPTPLSATPSSAPSSYPTPKTAGRIEIYNIFYEKPNLRFHYANRSRASRETVMISVNGGRERPLELALADPWRVDTSPPVDLRKFGVKPDNFDVEVTIRSEKLEFRRVLSHHQPVAYVTPSGKPDLVIDDVYFDGESYLKVKYHNQGGVGAGDFLIRLSHGEESFPGNENYRFPVPPPGQPQETGGFTIGLIGLNRGDRGMVRAEIDWEKRVDERDRSNNLWERSVDLR